MRTITAAILIVFLGAGASKLHAAQEQTVPAAESLPASNDTTSPNAAPSTVQGAIVPAPNSCCAGGCGTTCHPQGCCLKKLLIWATYCPKERVCKCNSFCCNSCQYKGVLPFYIFFLNPKCVEGTGLHPTFTNDCYRGCKGCAAGATCGQP